MSQHAAERPRGGEHHEEASARQSVKFSFFKLDAAFTPTVTALTRRRRAMAPVRMFRQTSSSPNAASPRKPRRLKASPKQR